MWKTISIPVLQTWTPEEISFNMAWSRRMTSAQWLGRFSTIQKILSDEGFRITGLFSKRTGETSFRVTRANARVRLAHLIQGVHTSSERTRSEFWQMKSEQPRDGALESSFVALKDYITNFSLSSGEQNALVVAFNETHKGIDERNQQAWSNNANTVAVFDDLLDTWSTGCMEANLIAMEHLWNKEDNAAYPTDLVQTECTDSSKCLHHILELFKKHRIIIVGLRFGWLDEPMVQHFRRAKLKNLNGDELRNCAHYDILAVVGIPDDKLQGILSHDCLTATIMEEGERIYLTDSSTTVSDKLALMGEYLLPYCKLQSKL